MLSLLPSDDNEEGRIHDEQATRKKEKDRMSGNSNRSRSAPRPSNRSDRCQLKV